MLRLRIYTITSDYPIRALRCSLNEQDVGIEVHSVSPGWSVVEVGPFITTPDHNTLKISPPLRIPVNQLQPDSLDSRSLSFAVAWVEPFL